MRDPNWLYSAIAQSSAALIAISGGFIATRLVSMQADRGELSRRRRRTLAELRSCRDELQPLEEQLLAEDGQELAEGSVDAIAHSLGRVTAEGLLKDSDLLERWSLDQLQPFVDPLIAIAKEASQAFDDYHAQRNYFTSAVDEVLAVGGVIPASDLERGVCSGVIEKRFGESSAGQLRKSGMFPTFDGLAFPTMAILDLPIADNRWPRLHQLREQHSDLADQVELQDRELGRLERPSSLRRLVGAFCLFLSAGVLFPLILMAIDPVPSAWWMRVLAISAFLLGVLAVGYTLVSPVVGDLEPDN